MHAIARKFLSNKIVQTPYFRAKLTRDSKPVFSFFTFSVTQNLAKMQNVSKISNDRTKTYVICGPSGSGKTTLLEMITSFYKDSFKFCVSHTTRQPRKNEQNGKAYYFVDLSTFQKMISLNEFVEYAQFSGNYYGTSYQELEIVKNSGRIPILDVDIRGVVNLKNIKFNAKYIFITTPTLEILERNLRSRGSESEDTLKQRLRHAIEDIKTAEKLNFDLVIVNSDLNESFQKFKDYVHDDVNKLSEKINLYT